MRLSLPSTLITTLLTTLPVAGPAIAWADEDERRVKTCQRLKTAIERYTDKRRAGGSPSQMETWKRARKARKSEWDDLRCRRLHRHLD
jgi:hypothetical protein